MEVFNCPIRYSLQTGEIRTEAFHGGGMKKKGGLFPKRVHNHHQLTMTDQVS